MEAQNGAVAHLVVHIVQGALEENNDAVGQGLDLGAKLAQSRHGSGAHVSVLQDDPVVDEADVLGRVAGGRAELAEHVEDLGRERGELAVLDELAEVEEPGFFRVRDAVNELQDGVYHNLFEIKAAFVAQDGAEKVEQDTLLGRELDAERADSADNNNFELVCNIRDEAGDLLHELFDGVLRAGLEKGRDRQGRDTLVRVSDEGLHVLVGTGDHVRVLHSDLVEGPHCREPEARLGRAEEELQDSDSRHDILRGDLRKPAHRSRRLQDDHLALVVKARLEELVRSARVRIVHVLVQELARVPDEQANSEWRRERGPGKLLHNAANGQAIVGLDRVKQR
mmetsp:Transcript_19502/g.55769  ORF Transcript_19502/g.55769 Transcript_19502/m.55769 type:complete len:338 (+) Transcript_19502:1117-2130(+)